MAGRMAKCGKWIAFGCTLLLLSILPSLIAGQARTPSAPPPPPAILLGTSWYPEQWPESRWDADLTLMQQAGVRVLRMGEFAWSRMEPAEGQFDLDWFDRAVTAAAKHNI